MKLLNSDQLRKSIAEYLDENKIGVKDYEATRDALTGLVHKIFESFTLESSYKDRTLDFLIGEPVTHGESVEEYFQSFILPNDYDRDGKDALAPARISQMKPVYSLGQNAKTHKTTIDFFDRARSFVSTEQAAEFYEGRIRRLQDSFDMWIDGIERQALKSYATKLDSTAIAPKDYAKATASTLKVGDYVKDAGHPLVVVTGAIANNVELADAIAQGLATNLDLETVLALPSDAAAGEAFLKSVKKYAGKFARPDSGFSPAGNIAGVAPKYKLVIEEGVATDIEVDTMAGAFHLDKLAYPVEVVKVKEGTLGEKVYAMLVDERAVKVRVVADKVTDEYNASGDFVNYFRHSSLLVHASPFTKGHIWKKAQ